MSSSCWNNRRERWWFTWTVGSRAWPCRWTSDLRASGIKIPTLAAKCAARIDGHPLRAESRLLSYDEQNGCRQPGAPADAVVDCDERDCARSRHDSDGGGALLRIAEWIEGEPDGRGSRPDGHAARGVVGDRPDWRADPDQSGRQTSPGAARGLGCSSGLVVHFKAS